MNDIEGKRRGSAGQLTLGFVALLVIAVIVLVALVCVLHLATRAAASFFSVLTTLDAAIVVALITGSISVVTVIGGSVLSGVLERRGKRREFLLARREESYNQLISIVYDMLDSQRKGKALTPDELSERMKEFNKALTLWGSSKAVRVWGKWRVSSGKGEVDPGDVMFGMEAVMIQLRRDVGQRRLSKGDLLRLTVNDIDEVLKK